MGHMDQGERSVFLTALASDGDLDARFREFKAAFRAVEEAGLRASMEEFQLGMDLRERQGRRSGFGFGRFPMIAASLAVLISLGLWFTLGPSANEKLFNKYFTADPGLPSVMGTGENYAFQEAMVQYKLGHYGTAISRWEALLPEHMGNDTLNYFLGSAYLAKGEAQKAIDYMERVGSQGETAFGTDVQYYLALAHLKLDQGPKALELLSNCREARCKELASKIGR